jgi:hypothetical protein
VYESVKRLLHFCFGPQSPFLVSAAVSFFLFSPRSFVVSKSDNFSIRHIVTRDLLYCTAKRGLKRNLRENTSSTGRRFLGQQISAALACILHVEKFARALRLRLSWFECLEPKKLCMGMGTPCNEINTGLFYAATSPLVVGMTIRVGQGRSHLPADVPGITAT